MADYQKPSVGRFCGSTMEQPERERDIIANNQKYNKKFDYVDNFIKTYKYTVFTFIPLNLFEQFKRTANSWFLVLFFLQLIPQISSITPITTGLPLICVISLTAVKFAYDDWQRYKADRQINNRKCAVLRNGSLVEVKWHNIQVGEVIKIENDDWLPADILPLSSSNPSGMVYIETAELDGETNLKVKNCLEETNTLGEDLRSLSEFDGQVICEPPNNNLSKFSGQLRMKGKTYALDNKTILYRGAVLKNTLWCYGLVIFAGRDTKLMQNSGQLKLKSTSIDKLLSRLIIGIVIFLMALCLLCSLASAITEYKVGYHFQHFLPWDSDLIPPDPLLGVSFISFLVFWSYVIVLNTLVPISLYVSVEIIRLFQSKLIDWDLKMYNSESDTPAKSRTTNLTEELGQVQYVFSDKTGTLTQNIMTFNKCSINGHSYGDTVVRVGDQPGNEQSQSQSSEDFKFSDPNLSSKIEDGDSHTHVFFRLLSLCHTVIPHEREDGSIEYQAQSPDENALVSAARTLGFEFTERSSRTITIQARGSTEVYELLCILDFNNVRKRMSVIVMYEDKIKLYTKGADNVIFERLARDQEEMIARTQEHLDKFASDGLRTLVLAERELTQQQFDDWNAEYSVAAVAVEDKDEKLDAVYEMIEKDLTLVGATAIEDKLQDGVPHTIANLELAGIKVWVLTGDKLETAVNIGYSCNLLSEDFEEPFIVNSKTYEEVMKQLKQHRQRITEFREEENVFSLVITGQSLEHALTPDMELIFLGVVERCQAVICCRVTPLQKALVVELIKKYKEAVTLSIGDGANDVAMIKAADIGIGISGQEGMQAVLASDYSIAQFKYLERLLLVHGRWSYYRICNFLRYFFYKNFAFTLCHLWYAFFSGFSAQTLFNDGFIGCYNLFYTNLPVLGLAFYDQDVSPALAVKYPNLYSPGRHSLFFNHQQFTVSAIHGFLTSLVLFGIPMGVYSQSCFVSGQVMSDHYLLGSVVATVLVLVVNVQVALDTTYWTVFNHFHIWASLISYFIFSYMINWLSFTSIPHEALGSLTIALTDPVFWLTSLLTTMTVIVPVLAWRLYQVELQPTLTYSVRLIQRIDKADEYSRPTWHSVTRRRARSGYAFDHSEGFGRVITSGKFRGTGSARRMNDLSIKPSSPVEPRRITRTSY